MQQIGVLQCLVYVWRQALCGVDEIEPSSIHTKTSSALKHTDGGAPSFASSAASGGNRRSGGGLVPTADIMKMSTSKCSNKSTSMLKR